MCCYADRMERNPENYKAQILDRLWTRYAVLNAEALFHRHGYSMAHCYANRVTIDNAARRLMSYENISF